MFFPNNHVLNLGSLKPLQAYLKDQAPLRLHDMKYPRFKIATQVSFGEENKLESVLDQSLSQSSPKTREKASKIFIPFVNERDKMGRIMSQSLHQQARISSYSQSMDILQQTEQQEQSNQNDSLINEQKGLISEPQELKKENPKILNKKQIHDLQFGKKRRHTKSTLILGIKDTEFIAKKYTEEDGISNHKTISNEVNENKYIKKSNKIFQKRPQRSISIVEQEFFKIPQQTKSILKDNKIVLNHHPKLFKAIDRSISVPAIGHYHTGKMYENTIFPRTRQTIISSNMHTDEKLREIEEREKLIKLQEGLEQKKQFELVRAQQKLIKASETDQINAQLKFPSVGQSKKYIKEFLERNRHIVLNVRPIVNFQGFPKEFEKTLIDQKKHIRELRGMVRAWGNDDKDNQQHLKDQAKKILLNATKQ